MIFLWVGTKRMSFGLDAMSARLVSWRKKLSNTRCSPLASNNTGAWVIYPDRLLDDGAR